MASSRDSDKKQALSWKNPSLSKIDKPIAAQSKASLFNSIKNALIAQTGILRENKSDQKYRNIVDLIMFRLKIDLENININYSSISASEIDEMVKSALDARLDNTYKTSSFVSILDFSNAILVELQKRSSSKDKNVDSQQNSTVGKQDEEQLDQHNANSQTKEKQQNARYSSTQKTSQSTKQTSSISSDSIQRIQTSIDQQFGKIVELCQTTQKKPIQSSKTVKNRKSIEVSKKQIAQQQKLEKRQTHSMQYAGEDEEPSKMPSSILTNNIYKYNKKMFENLTPPGIAQVLNIINAFQENASMVGKSFQQLFPIIEQGICAASSTTEKIYSEINKSIFAKILDFIKGKAISKYIIQPIRSKVIDLVLECLAKNKGRILSMVFAFMPFITGILKDILHGFIEGTANIRDGTASGIKTFGRILGKMLKTAFNAFVKTIKWTFKIGVAALKLAVRGIRMAIQAARALITIVRFAYKGIKFIVGLFKKTKLGKFLSKLGSKIKSAIDKVKGKVKQIAQKVKNVFNKGKEFVKKMLSKAKNAIKNFGKRVADTIKNVVKKVAKKVFNVVRNTAKKVVQKIMKKLGISVAKKIVKKKALSLLKMGAKKILGFFKKWVVKMIMKLAIKIAGAAAVNCIPILGQIISICMMLWTIIDTIITFWDVYKFMKEYPEAWDFMKEKVAEWADKAFNFMKKLREWGEKLFRAIFIEGPKKFAKGVAHLLNFLSNPVASAQKIAANAAYVKDLEAIKKQNFQKLDKMDPAKQAQFIKDKYKNNMGMLDKLRPKSEELTKKIQDEQESWWPNNKDILMWMEQRQVIHRAMMNYATEIGLSDFSQSTCNTAKQLVEEAEKKEAERIRIAKELAEHRKEMTLKYANKMIDLEALKTICKEYQDKFNEFNDDIRSLSKQIMTKSNKFIEQFEDITGDDYNKSEDDEEESLELAIV